MLRYVVLVPCEPLFCCRPDFIYQIELKAYALCPLKPSLDELEQGSVRNLNLPISLWVGGGGVVVSYF